jgi:transcriptional regulator with GAF, ATPase, and Fis domain
MDGRAVLLARLASAVADAPESESLTWRLCDAARRILGADGASISMDVESTNRVTLCATDEVSARLENLHDVLGEGPATEAFRTGRPVVVELGSHAPVWSAFAEAASRQTAAVVLVAVPMRAHTAVLGVLTLYRAAPGPLAEPMDEVAFLGDALAAALLHGYASSSDLGDGGSWSNRAEVHQATGMVVAQLAVDVRDALAILRAHAFALDRPLDEIAGAVVRREIDFTREEP